MATSISTTGTISSAGIGSGLDVNSIIAGLMKVENLPLTALQTKATSISTTISAFGAVQSATSSFRDAAAKLALPSTWNATLGTSSDPTAVSVVTTPDAATGNYSVQVTALAAAQSTVSTAVASDSALVGAGNLHIDLGSWDTGQTAFTAKTGSSGIDVTVTAGDTLATLAAKVNGANAGITASIVSDASGARLVYSSATTGTDNAFRISATDADGANTDASGLSAFAFDPAGGTSATTRTQAAANATATVNGLAVSSATNTLTNVFKGLTINLAKVGAAPVQITVAQNADSIKSSVNDFVTAYNSLSTLLSTDLKYDAGSQTAGPLQADSTAVSLQRQLRNLVGSFSTASSTFSTLSQVGVQIQSDGTLKVDSSALDSALANPAELKKMFTNVDSANPANNGIAVQLRSFGNAALGADGLLTTRVSGLNTTLTTNKNDQSTLSDRIAATQARLQAQYSALDTLMAGINSQSAYVTQQITNWNKGNG